MQYFAKEQNEKQQKKILLKKNPQTTILKSYEKKNKISFREGLQIAHKKMRVDER